MQNLRPGGPPFYDGGAESFGFLKTHHEVVGHPSLLTFLFLARMRDCIADPGVSPFPFPEKDSRLRGNDKRLPA